MTSTRQGRNVAIAGASGNIGRRTLNAMLAHNIHRITVIIRPDSKSSFPSQVHLAKAAYDDEVALTKVLYGQDILILQLPMNTTSYALAFVRAAAKAGVRYIIPTEFGSDPEAKLVEDLPEIIEKRQVRHLIEELGTSSWIAIINNPWYEYCLPLDRVIGIDSKARTATLWDGGNTKLNMTTMSRVAEATAEVVALPQTALDRYQNRCFYITSFYVTQRDILESVMRATQTSYNDWKLSQASCKEAIQNANSMTEAQPHEIMLAKFFPLHFRSGYGGDFNHKVEDLQRFGLEKENLDEVTAEVLKNGK